MEYTNNINVIAAKVINGKAAVELEVVMSEDEKYRVEIPEDYFSDVPGEKKLVRIKCAVNGEPFEFNTPLDEISNLNDVAYAAAIMWHFGIDD